MRESQERESGSGSLRGETVLVTGASSGIGLELARLFAADGAHLVLAARREDRLRALAETLASEYGTPSTICPIDLTDRDARGGLITDLTRRGIEVDVLVNSAGFGLHGAVSNLGLTPQMDMIEVNVAALTELTRLFLPGMLARGRGGILNVASTAAFEPGPNLSVYYGTKAYVLSFTEGLAEELRGTGLRVSCLAPGPTHTEFAEQAGMKRSLLFRLGTASALRVARAGHGGFRRGRTVVIPGILNRLLILGVRLAPRVLVRRVVGALHRRG